MRQRGNIQFVHNRGAGLEAQLRSVLGLAWTVGAGDAQEDEAGGALLSDGDLLDYQDSPQHGATSGAGATSGSAAADGVDALSMGSMVAE